jgi:type I restriction enzyme, S subunit
LAKVLINTPYHFLTQAVERLSEKGERVGRVVPPNSLLVTCIAGSPNSIGNAAIADRKVAFNQQINALIPNEPENIFFLYTQALVGKRLIQHASTNSMKGMVNKTAFSAIEFIDPPRSKKQRFGLVFSKLLNQKQRHLRGAEQFDNLFFSLQQRAFRGEL